MVGDVSAVADMEISRDVQSIIPIISKYQKGKFEFYGKFPFLFFGILGSRLMQVGDA